MTESEFIGTVKWWFSKRKIKLAVEKEISDWELNSDRWSDPKEIAKSLRYELERKFEEEIIRHVQIKIQSDDLLNKLAEACIAEFDMKPLYMEALKNKVRDTMFDKNNKNERF